jgi:S-adenosylmethionine hydrolase
MIALFTDFGVKGPYLGQVQIVLQQQAPDIPVVNLIADAPQFSPHASAHLLAALGQRLPLGTVVFAVVDPGVGSREREPIIVFADSRWYVGPGNGLLDVVMGRATSATLWRIIWQPSSLSATFHGRDLFAPIVAKLAQGEKPYGKEALGEQWDEALIAEDPGDLEEIIYIDGYGNAMTGVRAATKPSRSRICLPSGDLLSPGRTFGDVDLGEGFWYENSLGLIEIAVNQGCAAIVFKLEVGMPIQFV